MTCLAGAEIEAAGLEFEVPVTWNPTVPRSQMRKAQVAIPGAGGDAELAVFHFGEGQGGGVDANLARWVAQIEMPKGVEPQREYFEDDGFAVTMLTASGTLRAGRMGMGPKEAQADSMLLGAVVEGPGGPWFFKATGPAKTLAPQRDAFVAIAEKRAARLAARVPNAFGASQVPLRAASQGASRRPKRLWRRNNGRARLSSFGPTFL